MIHTLELNSHRVFHISAMCPFLLDVCIFLSLALVEVCGICLTRKVSLLFGNLDGILDGGARKVAL